MAYILNEVTIRTDNTAEGMKKIDELWSDVASGRLPVLFDSSHSFKQGISPVSRYSHYASDETGAYDLSILGVTADFFRELERKTADGIFKKYDACDESGDIKICTQKAWKMVWTDSKNGVLNRSYLCDYESAVPAEYTKDGKAHCYLYISVEQCTG